MASSTPPLVSSLRRRKLPERKYTYIKRPRPAKGTPSVLRPKKRTKWLSADSIALRLTKQCCKRSGEGSCLESFSPAQIRARLEWNLGQTEQKILEWLAGYLIDHRSEHGAVCYMVLTKPVCLKAFQRFHGISDHKIKRGRVMAAQGNTRTVHGNKSARATPARDFVQGWLAIKLDEVHSFCTCPLTCMQ
jgi:hypothetical protein